MAREQEQFLDVVDRDEAERRWRRVVGPRPLRAETVALLDALGRVLVEKVTSAVDVPAFDRSNFDGYALRAEDSVGADEERPARLALNAEELATGRMPALEVSPGTATPIATGAVLPRGADAVAPVEHARLGRGQVVELFRPQTPGSGVTFAGTDIARGERVLGRGTLLTSRETAVLAAIGCPFVEVVRRPRVAIASTGDEVVPPDRAPLPPAAVYDSNATMLAHAVVECGGEPIVLGVFGDDRAAIESALARGLDEADLIVLSGGTSKGAGDLSYRALADRDPGIAVHGVALKPGKPVCLGAIGRTPVAILPGFPTSALFTFHEFVAPLIREWAGLGTEDRAIAAATLAVRVNSESGRTEYVLARLLDGPRGLTAYPIGKGSGSVSAFQQADGFFAMEKDQEYAEAGERVAVTLSARHLKPADLTVIGSHCVGLDLLLDLLADAGYASKTTWVGSSGGLFAAGRGECDLAGVHLLDPRTGRYNDPFLSPGVGLLRGYDRLQGVVHRIGDPRYEGRRTRDAIAEAVRGPSGRMVNRNRGSGTRVLIDELIGAARPPGHAVEARSHNAVAASVAQGRADWGVAIATVAAGYGLGFVPLRPERYDFAIPEARWDRPPVAAFRALLDREDVRGLLARLGFTREEGGA